MKIEPIVVASYREVAVPVQADHLDVNLVSQHIQIQAGNKGELYVRIGDSCGSRAISIPFEKVHKALKALVDKEFESTRGKGYATDA